MTSLINNLKIDFQFLKIRFYCGDTLVNVTIN